MTLPPVNITLSWGIKGSLSGRVVESAGFQCRGELLRAARGQLCGSPRKPGGGFLGRAAPWHGIETRARL
jgi:hypothetical protein